MSLSSRLFGQNLSAISVSCGKAAVTQQTKLAPFVRSFDICELLPQFVEFTAIAFGISVLTEHTLS